MLVATRVQRSDRPLANSLTRPALLAVVYYACAALALAMSEKTAGPAVIWPASGILLAAILLAPPTRSPLLLAGAGLASMAANLQFGVSLVEAAGFTVANLVEPIVAAWFLRAPQPRHALFTTQLGLLRLSLAALIASATSSMLATLVTGPSPAFAAAWMLSDLLGILIIVPFVVLAADSARAGVTKWGAGTRDTIGWFLLLAGVSVATFAQTSFPTLFVPMMVLLLMVFRLGALGGAAGIVGIAAIGAVATGTAHGPVSMITAGRDTHVIFFQLYLLSLFASALPIAALLVARDRLSDELAAQNRLLTLAESTAHVGHWRLDMRDGSLLWSEETFQIYGLSPDTVPSPELALAGYHVDDRRRIAAVLDGVMADGSPFDLSARLMRPDGEVRHLVSRGGAERGYSGDIVALFGILQDVTDHVKAAAALRAALAAAENAAEQATIAAETDSLTGLANRRKVMDVLDHAIERATSPGHDLSLAIFDLDHFKTINDTYGHGVGDQVLQRVARDARAALRDRGLVGRLGGEEFVLVLPGAGSQQAFGLAEEVRRAIEATTIASREGPRVSASFGVATLAVRSNLRDAAAKDLLTRADKALYAAKCAGRNTLRQAA